MALKDWLLEESEMAGQLEEHKQQQAERLAELNAEKQNGGK